MPLIERTDITEPRPLTIGLWHITETLEQLVALYPLHELEANQIQGLKDRKLKEWYSARILLSQCTNQQAVCIKDEFGKPHLLHSEAEISISHSHDTAAVIVSSSPVGIDIQYFVPKIDRIANKFVSQDELDQMGQIPPLLFYHFVWGAKESLYKAYGRGSLDLKNHMSLQQINATSPSIFTAKGIITKDQIQQQYRIYGTFNNQIMQVYAI